MNHLLNGLLFAAILLPLNCLGQDQATAAIAGGKVLLSQLKGDPASDALVFRDVGADRAQQLLQAVTARGMAKNATLEDWADLHRAFDGLMALEIFRNNPAKAAAYAFLNDTYYRNDEKNYQAALVCARQSLELNRAGGQPLFLAYKSVGEDLRSLNRLTEAMESFRQARIALPDKVDKTAADLLREMVETLLSQGRREEAGQVASEMMAQAAGAPPIYRARAWLAQSDLLFADGQYAAGVDAVKSAVAATAGTTDEVLFPWEAASQLVAAVLDGLSTLSYGDAGRLAQLADSQIPGLPIQVTPFAQLAIRQRRRLAGELDAVLREDAARVTAARQRGDLRELSESLKSLAGSYASVNGIEQRVVALEEAVETEQRMFPENGIPKDMVSLRSHLNLLNALGEAYLDLARPGPARRTFEAELKIDATFQSAATQNLLRSSREAATMGRAAALAMDDDPDGARDLLNSFLRTVSPANRPYALLQVGRLERTLNENPSAAVDAYRQAIAGLHAALDYPQELAARLTLARYLATRTADLFPEGRQKALEQLSAAESLSLRMEYADAGWRLDYLYGVLEEPANPQAALARYRQAVAKLNGLRAGLSQQEQRQSLLDNESAADLHLRLIALLTRAGLHEEAWQYLERAKARSFLEELQGRRFAADAVSPPLADLDSLEKQMGGLRFQLLPENESALRAGGREPASLKLALKDLEAKFTLAREQAGLSRSRTGQVLSLQPPPLARIQEALPPHAVLVEYGLLEGQVTAFVVTRTAAEQVSWKADMVTLRRNVLRLRTLLSDPGSTDWPSLLAEVSETLVTPLAARIPADSERILVVPAGYLNYLPFPALTLPDGRALVEVYAVSYLPSASSLLYLGTGAQPPGKLFLGALGTSAVDGMPPLPGTLTETAAIAEAYPNATRVTGAAFTHDAARRALLENDTVHFATHGLLEADAPLFSALLTSPADGQPSRLSLYELVGAPIRAKLVVLSACETGLGKLLGGDEIAGLTRTLLTAGADTVVASLWKVSDESTAMLMQEFYRQMGRGMLPAAALRQSVLAVKARYKHPFYWAPFVVTGRN